MAQDQTGLQHNDFIISLAGPNIDTTIVNIEELSAYVSKRKRIAIVATEKKSYDNLDKMTYQLAYNYHKPKVMVVTSKKKPYLDVYSFLLDRFQGGLIVIETDTLSEPISDLVCGSQKLAKNDIDIMICRDGIQSMTIDEFRKANFLRIHANPDLDFNVFQKYSDILKEKMLPVLICHFFVNDQYTQVVKYMDASNERYTKLGMKDYVDYYEMNKQLSYFLYFDMINIKIIGITAVILEAFMMRMKKNNMLPKFSESQVKEFAKDITVE